MFVSPSGKYIALDLIDESPEFEFADVPTHKFELLRSIIPISYLKSPIEGNATIKKMVQQHQYILKFTSRMDCTSVSFSFDDKLMATATLSEEGISIRSTEGGAYYKTRSGTAYRWRNYPWFNLGFSPDGRTLYALGNDSILAYDTSDGAQKYKKIIPDPKNSAQQGRLSGSSVAFSPAKLMYANPFEDGTIGLIDAQNGDMHYTDKCDGKALSCAFSPDGVLLLSTWDDTTTRLFQVRSGVEICKILRTHPTRQREYCDIWSGIMKTKEYIDPAHACAFSPISDEPLIITGLKTGLIKIWDISSVLAQV